MLCSASPTTRGLVGLNVVYPKGLHSLRDAPLPSLAHLPVLPNSHCFHIIYRLAKSRFDSLDDAVIAVAGAWASLELDDESTLS